MQQRSNNFVVSGGAQLEKDGTWSVACSFSKIESEHEAILVSQWLHELIYANLDRMGALLPNLPTVDQETIIEQLRDHVADTHRRDCAHNRAKCICGYDQRTEELIREAAARIEVAVDALTGSSERPPSLKGAFYALTAERHT
jgi:hypothetical protein